MKPLPSPMVPPRSHESGMGVRLGFYLPARSWSPSSSRTVVRCYESSQGWASSVGCESGDRYDAVSWACSPCAPPRASSEV
eukprot:33486-Eustigmatos_ZCMA.PRE.1